jgi:hypothetical protein
VNVIETGGIVVGMTMIDGIVIVATMIGGIVIVVTGIVSSLTLN